MALLLDYHTGVIKGASTASGWQCAKHEVCNCEGPATELSPPEKPVAIPRVPLHKRSKHSGGWRAKKVR